MRLPRALLLVLLLLPCGPAISQAKPAPPLVTWQELVDHPARHLGERLTLRGQFRERVASWSPYLTRFGPREFGAFQLWSDEQFPWVEAEYQLPRVRLFARRGEPAECVLGGAATYTRFELTVVVRELFLDLPWIEVERATPLAEQISEGTNIHAARAIELAGKESWALAVQEFEQALAGALPEHARAELVRLRDEAQTRAKAKAGH